MASTPVIRLHTKPVPKRPWPVVLHVSTISVHTAIKTANEANLDQVLWQTLLALCKAANCRDACYVRERGVLGQREREVRGVEREVWW